MTRYVITQEQLDHLQRQLQQISQLSEIKEQRIKSLESGKVKLYDPNTANLMKTIGSLENEIKELRNANRHLSVEAERGKKYGKQIKEIETLLEEERKLRRYSEEFANQVEIKCADEAEVRRLTTELCHLQRDEIDLANKRILQLQKKIKKLSTQIDDLELHSEKESRNNSIDERRNSVEERRNSKEERREITVRQKNLKSLVHKLQEQLIDLYKNINQKPIKTNEDEIRKKDLERWLGNISGVMNDLNDIEDIKQDLNILKHEIESRKKSVSLKKN